MKCKQCDKELKQTGNRERLFCDATCRMAYNRLNSKANKNTLQSEQIQSEHPEIQSEQVKANKHINGTCFGCSKPQPNPLTEICSECIAKGLTRKSLKLEDAKKEKTKQTQNWQRIGLRDIEEYKAYIVWYLTKQGLLDNNIITIGNRIYGNYKQRARDNSNSVKEFRTQTE